MVDITLKLCQVLHKRICSIYCAYEDSRNICDVNLISHDKYIIRIQRNVQCSKQT